MGVILIMRRWGYPFGMEGPISARSIGDGRTISRRTCYPSKILLILVSTSRYLSDPEDLPFDTANDISRGSYAIQKVRTTFAGAHGILTAAAYLRAGMMRS